MNADARDRVSTYDFAINSSISIPYLPKARGGFPYLRTKLDARFIYLCQSILFHGSSYRCVYSMKISYSNSSPFCIYIYIYITVPCFFFP